MVKELTPMKRLTNKLLRGLGNPKYPSVRTLHILNDNLNYANWLYDNSDQCQIRTKCRIRTKDKFGPKTNSDQKIKVGPNYSGN